MDFSYERGERRLDVLELRQVVDAIGLGFLDFIARLDAVLQSHESPTRPA